jgi:two-component system response regulator NreC
LKIRLLLVDDHEVVREGLKFLFANARPEWEVCGEASNADDAIAQAKQLKPDVILLDISMPGTSGLAAAPVMRKVGISSPILIFTTHQSDRLAGEVRTAGAQGFVTKSQAFRDLVRAIDIVVSGGTFFGTALPGYGEKKIPEPSGPTYCLGLQIAWQP